MDQKLLKLLKALPVMSLYSVNWVSPTSNELKTVRKIAGITQVQVAQIVGAPWSSKRGAPTVRNWEAPMDSKEHRKMPYAAWRLLVIHLGFIEHN